VKAIQLHAKIAARNSSRLRNMSNIVLLAIDNIYS